MNLTSPEHIITIPDTSIGQSSSSSAPPRHPATSTYHGIMYDASIKGDWEFAEFFIHLHPELVRESITENDETLLHVAASTKSTKQVEEFVKKLVDLLEPEDLELINKNGNTALSLAAGGQSVKIVEIMVKKNRSLLHIPDSQGMKPLKRAALLGSHDVVQYLYDNSNFRSDDYWTYENRGGVLLQCIEADYFDIALDIMDYLLYGASDQVEAARDRLEAERATHIDLLRLFERGHMLDVLARKPNAFREIDHHFTQKIIGSVSAFFHLKVAPPKEKEAAMKLLRTILDYVRFDLALQNSIEDGIRMELKQALFVAAEMGNIVFIVEAIRRLPDQIWVLNNDNQSIFHVAVLHRQKDVYNLLYDMGSNKDLITTQVDGKGNNMLHLVGEFVANKQLPNISGVALQMQREITWFKEVKAMIPHSYRQKKNKDNLTPHELFIKNHVDLASKGEAWMKETAAQCIVVATLIATVVFAAAFTIPGGYDQSTGLPMFLHNRWFMAFVISDTVSLVLASTSILMFLSLLTARYTQEDFFYTLPRKLLIGLTTLFLSIMSMMITFSVSFSVLYHKNLIWVPILTSVLSAIPVYFFAKSQYPLLKDVFFSTYGSTYLFKSRKFRLYAIK